MLLSQGRTELVSAILLGVISILILSPCPGSPRGKMGGTGPTKQRGPAQMEIPLMRKTTSAIYQRKVEKSKEGMEDILDQENTAKLYL